MFFLLNQLLLFVFRFLIEFMEAGGLLTVLEIVKYREAKESDKTEALKLLLQIINSGRQYKEFMCENGAIRGVAECLGNSTNIETQEASKQVCFLIICYLYLMFVLITGAS